MNVTFLYADEKAVKTLLRQLTVTSVSYGEAAAKPDTGAGSVSVNWGIREKGHGAAEHGLALNGRASNRAFRGKEQAAAMLRLIGLAGNALRETENVYTHRYRIYTFHLEVVAVLRSRVNSVYTLRTADGRWEYDGNWQEDADQKLRRAQKAALRAIYALGLDFGMAEVGIDSSGKAVVFSVEPFPALDERLAEPYARAIERFREQAAVESGLAAPAVLGADPEFLLLNALGQVVPASAYLPFKGTAGCDVVRIGDRRLYPLAELRPAPSSDPKRLIVHLRRALQRAADLIPDTPGLKWVAGGMPAKGFALGGHIHFSGVWLNVFILRALDNYLALPLLLIEDGRSKGRRRRYGLPGDYRLQPHGFEYRTLPSWLVSPSVAKGVLALASLISRHYWLLLRRPLSDGGVLSHYMEGDKGPLLAHVLPQLDEIRRLPDYAEFEAMIEPLFARIVRMESWDERQDIRPGWKICPPVVQGR